MKEVQREHKKNYFRHISMFVGTGEGMMSEISGVFFRAEKRMKEKKSKENNHLVIIIDFDVKNMSGAIIIRVVLMLKRRVVASK